MLSIRRILHPTDFSEHCYPAFELACALARDYDAEVVVLHVAQLPLLTPVDGVLVPTPLDEAEHARKQLEQVRPADSRVKVVHRLVEGDPAGEILQAAGDLSVDLIVMGSHGRGGLARLLMGSVAEAVLRKARCPVLTVRKPFPVTQSATLAPEHAAC
jgi:nucleotide-binding universal stress UspA family protein